VGQRVPSNDERTRLIFKKSKTNKKLSAMKIDPALTEQGDWVGNIPDLPGIRIKAQHHRSSGMPSARPGARYLTRQAAWWRPPMARWC
jgi:hypothetical protein